MIKLEYGGIYLANLNPAAKKAPLEVSKTRPVLVIQTKALLDIEHGSTIILPLSTKLLDNNPLHFRISAQRQLKQDSDVLLDQIRAIDNRRFQNSQPLCVLPFSEMAKIYRALIDLLKP